MENKTYNYILNEILSKVLELSENPSQFAEYLTQQIRELVGARTIAIAVKEDSGQTKIYSVFPVRRTNWANQSAVLSLAERSFDFKSVQFLEKESSDEKIQEILQSLEIEQVIAIPLIAANHLVGSILLLDIMDSNGIDSVITLLKQLSGVFALVIRNSNLYQNMEDLVAIRTSELQMRNKDLHEREQQLLVANEEYEVLNEELTENIQKIELINQELVEAKDRAEKSERQTHDILQTAMDGFWIVDQEGQFLEVNEIACQILGYSSDEMLQLRIADIEVLETAEVVKSRIEKIKKSGEDRFESQHRCKDGRIVDVEVSTKIQGSRNLFVCFIHDISSRKKSEKELLRIQELLNQTGKTAKVGGWEMNVQTMETSFTEETFHIYELPVGVVPKLEEGINLYAPEARPIITKAVMDAIEKNIPYDIEVPFINANGNRKWIRTIGNTELENGKVVRLNGIIQDITAQKLAKEEIAFQANMLSHISEAIMATDLQGSIIYWNNPAEKLYGWKSEEVIGKNVVEVTPSSTTKEQAAEIFDSLTKGQNWTGEFMVKNKQGHSFTAMVSDSPVFDSNHNLIGIIGISSDITMRKQAEKELLNAKEKAEESEEKYRLLYDSNQMPISIFDADSLKFLSVNNAMAQKYGYTKEEFLTMTILDIRPESESGKVKQLVSAKDEGLVNAGIFLHKKKSGEIIQVEIIRCEIDFEGKRAKMVFAHDVSDRIKMEQELLRANNELQIAKEKAEESEERYALVIKASEQGIWDWNVETNEVFYSEQWKNQIGYEDYELKNEFNTWVEHLHPDEKEHCQNAVLAYLNQPVEHFILDFRFRHKDGTYRWIHNKAASLRNSEGKVVRLFGSHTDITESKLSEAIFKDIIEKNPISIQILDMEGYSVQFNSAHAKLFGAEPPSNYSIFNDNQLLSSGFGKFFEQLKKGEDVFFPDTYFNVHDVDPSFPDSPVWVKALGFSLRDSAGNPNKIVLMHENIFERKKAELDLIKINEQFRLSNQLLEESQKVAKLGGWELDIFANKLFWTAETYRIHETSPEEFNPTVDAGVSYFLPESKKTII